MSYILDALRKSDQERARGAAPRLSAGQFTSLAPKQDFPLAYGVLAIALVGSGIFIGWLRPWQNEPATRAAQSTIANTSDASPRPASPAAPAPSAALPPPQPAAQLQAVTAPAAAKAEVRAAAKPEARIAPQRSADSGKQQPAASGAALLAPVPVVISLAELPVAIQQELPPMSISVHAYSGKPKERLVGINNQLLREGASPAPGLTLEQITPEGMIFSYKGYTFRRGVQ